MIHTPGQRQGGDWQPLFIREHLMAIAPMAWSGFLRHGQGMLVCTVEFPAGTVVDWSLDTVDYRMRFMPIPEAIEQLQVLRLDRQEQAELAAALTHYYPRREIILWLSGYGETQVLRLKNLAIAPADAYAQLNRRWDEFQFKRPSEPRMP